MYRHAVLHRLSGFVCNDEEGVWLEIEGAPAEVEQFMVGLATALPLMAHIDQLETVPLAPDSTASFEIRSSRCSELARAPSMPPDLAPCAACLAELTDPSDRRYRYPFINCTSCGPRYTIAHALPYDRQRTTMGVFTMCGACQREYDDPFDRRFHAQPNACSACGPELAYVVEGTVARYAGDALEAACQALADGAVVAVHGAGGFALAVDACSDPAVARLRERKRRPHKPFAVMARDLEHAELIAVLDPAARRALQSPARPIVLVPAREDSAVAASVAPALTDLGVFLPPTPLQVLLLQQGPPLQVMTSGNLAGGPITTSVDAAIAELRGIADGFLVHDRAIHARADDPVVRIIGGEAVPIRLGRGTVPELLLVPVDAPPVLAVGGGFKSTLCMARNDRALLSPHIGDLDHPEVWQAFLDTAESLPMLAGYRPEVVAHDLHPDYRSTKWARALGLPCVAVQHHHAHVAACMAEHGRREPVIGVAFDGTGFGADGTMWGGELMLADLATFRRVGHVRALALPGGEAAIRAPWRLAVAAAMDAGIGPEISANVAPGAASLSQIAAHPELAPRVSSAGRWFDAVAAMCGLATAISYEGQAAGELESAASAENLAPYPFELAGTPLFEIDLRPAMRALATDLHRGMAVAVVARRFHETMAAAIAAGCRAIAGRGDTPSIETVALSGGCFQNRLLTERTGALLRAAGFEVLVHRRVPPNDGGLSLGQAVVAAARLEHGGRRISCA